MRRLNITHYVVPRGTGKTTTILHKYMQDPKNSLILCRTDTEVRHFLPEMIRLDRDKRMSDYCEHKVMLPTKALQLRLQYFNKIFIEDIFMFDNRLLNTVHNVLSRLEDGTTVEVYSTPTEQFNVSTFLLLSLARILYQDIELPAIFSSELIAEYEAPVKEELSRMSDLFLDPKHVQIVTECESMVKGKPLTTDRLKVLERNLSKVQYQMQVEGRFLKSTPNENTRNDTSLDSLRTGISRFF